jgi:hypothetical protein
VKSVSTSRLYISVDLIRTVSPMDRSPTKSRSFWPSRIRMISPWALVVVKISVNTTAISAPPIVPVASWPTLSGVVNDGFRFAPSGLD